VTVPSTTGGANIHGCGDLARRYCLGEDPIPSDVVAAVHRACRRAGLPTG
jgi:hypothetical protein